MTRYLICLALVVALAATGCDADVSTLRKMAETTEPSNASANQLAVLDKMDRIDEQDRGPSSCRKLRWRLEAIRTVVLLEEQFNLSSDDPARYDRLVESMRREVDLRLGGRDASRHRAWALWGLGRVDPSLPLSKVVDELEPHPGRNTLVQLVAFDVLHRREDDLRSDPSLRRRVLKAVAAIRANVHSARRTPEVVRLDEAAASMQQKLGGYPAVVDLLLDSRDNYPGSKALAEVLRWLYRRMALGEHRGDDVAGLRTRASGRLLELTTSDDAAVCGMARTVLAEFHPRLLMDQLAARLARPGANPVGDDAVALARLVVHLDQSKTRQRETGDSGEYDAMRAAAMQALAAKLHKLEQSPREVVLSVMLDHDRPWLTEALVRLARRAEAQSAAEASQVLRYVDRILKRPPDGAPVQHLEEATAGYLDRDEPAIRRQAVSMLLSRRPDLVVRGLAPVIDQLHRQPAETAADDLDAYLAALVEARRRDADWRPPQGSLSVLDGALRRDEIVFAARVAAYMHGRDPSGLAGMLARDVARRMGEAPVPLQRWRLLTQALRSDINIDAATGRDVVDVLVRGACSRHEAEALFCARHVVELGEVERLRRAGPALPAVRTLMNLDAATNQEDVQP